MDPDGRDIVISGVLSNEALRQLQDRVGNGLTLSMSTTGTVSYMVNTNKKLRGNARRMVRTLDLHPSITDKIEKINLYSKERMQEVNHE